MVVFQSQRMPRFSLALAGLHRETSSAVRVAAVLSDTRSPVLRYEPGHPDADKQGYVAYPQVDPVEEMTDLLGAVRAYELNASAIQATKGMIQQSLDLVR